MKTWMKILMWAGLGGGFGFFIGYQVGQKTAERQAETEEPDAMEAGYPYRYERAVEEYRAEDNETEEPEMPMEPMEIGDEEEIEIDIPQLHPQHLVPMIITEDEYNENEAGFNLENLIFYEEDNVLFNETTNTVIPDPDEAIGIGTLRGFSDDPNSPVETIYVRNDTICVMFRIDRIDAAYGDITGGGAPEYDEED